MRRLKLSLEIFKTFAQNQILILSLFLINQDRLAWKTGSSHWTSLLSNGLQQQYDLEDPKSVEIMSLVENFQIEAIFITQDFSILNHRNQMFTSLSIQIIHNMLLIFLKIKSMLFAVSLNFS